MKYCSFEITNRPLKFIYLYVCMYREITTLFGHWVSETVKIESEDEFDRASSGGVRKVRKTRKCSFSNISRSKRGFEIYWDGQIWYTTYTPRNNLLMILNVYESSGISINIYEKTLLSSSEVDSQSLVLVHFTGL